MFTSCFLLPSGDQFRFHSLFSALPQGISLNLASAFHLLSLHQLEISPAVHICLDWHCVSAEHYPGLSLLKFPCSVLGTDWLHKFVCVLVLHWNAVLWEGIRESPGFRESPLFLYMALLCLGQICRGTSSSGLFCSDTLQRLSDWESHCWE